MSKSALLDILPGERRKTIMHEEDGKTYVESRQDVEPLIEWIGRAKDRPQDPEFRHAAEVPMTVLNQAFIEGWFHDPKAWKKWLNDPDNRAFRVWEGRL